MEYIKNIGDRCDAKVSPNMRDDDAQSLGTALVHQPSVPTNRRPPRSRQASCDHDDMVRQLLHHVERLSDKYEETNRKVDTIMNWMRPSQHLDRDHSFGNDGVFGTEGDNHEEIERKMETVVKGTKRKVETEEIGNEAVARSIEREVAIGEEAERTGGRQLQGSLR